MIRKLAWQLTVGDFIGDFSGEDISCLTLTLSGDDNFGIFGILGSFEIGEPI